MDEFTISELFYCLLQDIEDLTMNNPHELDKIVEILDEINLKELSEKLTEEDKSKLKDIRWELECKGYEQFAEDLSVIIERINHEIK